MNKRSLIMLFVLIMLVGACSNEKNDKEQENNNGNELIDASKEVKNITFTGNGLAIFSATGREPNNKEIVFENAEEIEIMLNAIKNSSFHSGPNTAEGENFKVILSYDDKTSDTILLWLYPDKNFGKIQKENYSESVYLLSKEDVQSIAKLLNKRISQ